MAIKSLIEQLERDEDFVGHAYQDSLGFWTIGYGTLIDERKGGGITQSEAEYLLTNRLQKAMSAVDAAFPWASNLDAIRHAVLYNMAYQMGIDGLSKFKNFLSAMEAGNWLTAAGAGLDSVWAKEQSPDRAKRLMQQVVSGVWQ